MQAWGVLPWGDPGEAELQDARVLNKVLLYGRRATPAGEVVSYATGLLLELRSGVQLLVWPAEDWGLLRTAAPADLAPLTADLVPPVPA